MTPERARDIITHRLHPGEKLIWHGAPNPWRLSSLYMFFVPGLYLGGSGSLRLASVDLVKSNFGFVVIFLLIFCGLCLSYLFLVLLKIFNAWRTVYGVTDKRVIVAIGASKTESYEPAALEWMNRGGSAIRGDIRLGKPDALGQPEVLIWQVLKNPNGFFWNSLWRAGPFDKPGLYDVRDPARVEALIRETLLKPSKQGAAA